MSLKGIDISQYQAGAYKRYIDNCGKDFVIVRAAFNRVVDKTCDKAYQYAKSQGKKLGVYFFPIQINYTPEVYAKWCYDQVKGYIGEACFFLDWEDYNYQGRNINPTSNTNWAYEWLVEFERLTGNKPLIYMNSSVEANNNWSKVVRNGNGLWIANFGINDGLDHGYSKTRNWHLVAAHQYTSRLGGNSLDGDVFFGDRKAWSAYARVSKPISGVEKPVEKPEPQPQPKPQKPVEQPETEKPQEHPTEPEKPAEQQDSGQIQQNNKDLEQELKDAQELIKKLTATVELVGDTQKKHHLPSLEMPNKLYDFLKFMATTGLPAINTLYIGLANIWGIGFGPQVDATIQLIIAFINAITGAVVIKAGHDHAKKVEK